ncbi:glycosyltransferase family 4 protein [Modestobacter sp. L9-4]|uniref:glycosyltransferase family 4 protein n=1 Tax=Modestobacter sp. L9-4 TaxID=2851567 RepID=UPI001C7927FD|nr:glycosyltransferase family 4 protein [Modestobacter sp. L9-4]QXG74973.1 glycosyltransferase family 4 protein [Modestobacter sp. L9-4]
MPQQRVLVAHPGAELYGSDRMVAESVAGLVEAGCQVVVALPATGPLVARLEQLGASVVQVRMPVLRKSALSPRGLAALVADAVTGLPTAFRLARRAGRDGVYVSTLTLPLWPVVARLAGRRVTVHVHEAEGSQPALLRAVLAAPTLVAHRVLVNSRYAQDVLARTSARVAHRATVVHNGVAGPPAVHPPRPVLDDPLRLVFVGRLSHRKGPQVAVALLAELARRGVTARLQLAGAVFEGNEAFAEDLRAQVAGLGLTGQVDLLGFTDDVWSVLAANDVVLVPSLLDEPFGNTAVEAVLAARPVVVSATSGLREAAAGYPTAVVVPPGDVAAWADAVQGLTADWPAVVSAVQDSLRTAVERHAPATYRTRLAALTLTGAAGGRRDGEGRPGRRRA